ncbi:hypothetical protein RFI_22889 [Reticulomyxa filosa]|uniref:Beta-hexosaminidase eukaryotic type N-terminal domain-containing protein n=1 Tax=Reticulomyxa filosa TaxID=46433 RepID=X6MKW4_RETFI|nr:hypothetical protein RFI_22889 [Reticulomyxa filosa]|eukprot:ETO14479.1 hypothetical protein RFI_22889 [Reticulomyxa filosa]
MTIKPPPEFEYHYHITSAPEDKKEAIWEQLNATVNRYEKILFSHRISSSSSSSSSLSSSFSQMVVTKMLLLLTLKPTNVSNEHIIPHFNMDESYQLFVPCPSLNALCNSTVILKANTVFGIMRGVYVFFLIIWDTFNIINM